MSIINDRFCRARQLARELHPQWSRRMRAKWVIAKLRAVSIPVEKRAAVSSGWEHNPDYYIYRRTA